MVGMAASMLPDADVFLFGANYDSVWSHRGVTHSVAFALLVAAIAAALLRRVAPPLTAFAFVFVATVSHGLLDMLTNGGHGVGILWPLSDQRYFFDWRPIQVAPLVTNDFAPRFIARSGALARTEGLWIWVPAVIVAMALRMTRKGAAQ
jgi:inner membrane protein